MERVVSRDDLDSEESSLISVEEDVNKKPLPNDFEIVALQPGNHTHHEYAQASNEKEDAFEFRLFGATNSAGAQHADSGTLRIRLRSQSVDKEKAGLVQPSRDSGYYFARPTTSSEKVHYEAAALSGKEVLAQAQIPWPGSEYAWKVLHLPLSAIPKGVRIEQQQTFQKLIDAPTLSKRTKPGKKYRIKLRQKRAQREAHQNATKIAAEAREAAQREKRTKRNREKKVKKRQRDKAKEIATITNPSKPVVRDPSDHENITLAPG